MKALQIVLLLAFSLALLHPAQAAQTGPVVPKYNKSSEAVFKGTVQEVRDRQCPMSGGIGSHLVMRLTDGKVIEVHLATTHFVHQYDLVFHAGETLEITGVKVNFEGVETIFARKIKRGTDEFLFRDNDGKPIW
jgi:hypothetical protein